MKRTFILAAFPLLLAGCAGSNAAQTQAMDPASYQALKLSVNSNSERVLKLEKDLDSAKSEIDSLRTQNRQLADSYDGLVALMKEHRGLTMAIIQKMNTLTMPAPAENTEKK